MPADSRLVSLVNGAFSDLIRELVAWQNREMTAAVPHGHLFPHTSDAPPAETPKSCCRRLRGRTFTFLKWPQAHPAPFETAPEPLFPPSKPPSFDQSTPPDEGHHSDQSALANPPEPKSSTDKLLAGSRYFQQAARCADL